MLLSPKHIVLGVFCYKEYTTGRNSCFDGELKTGGSA